MLWDTVAGKKDYVPERKKIDMMEGFNSKKLSSNRISLPNIIAPKPIAFVVDVFQDMSAAVWN